MQTYLSMTIALFTIFIKYVLTLYVYPIMRMSAEKRAAELEADPNLFFNNFAFICLTCFECRACDNIAMHCATTHNNADFDLAWSSLSEQMVIIADADEIGAQGSEFASMQGTIQELIDEMPMEDTPPDIFTVD